MQNQPLKATLQAARLSSVVNRLERQAFCRKRRVVTSRVSNLNPRLLVERAFLASRPRRANPSPMNRRPSFSDVHEWRIRVYKRAGDRDAAHNLHSTIIPPAEEVPRRDSFGSQPRRGAPQAPQSPPSFAVSNHSRVTRYGSQSVDPQI